MSPSKLLTTAAALTIVFATPNLYAETPAGAAVAESEPAEADFDGPAEDPLAAPAPEAPVAEDPMALPAEPELSDARAPGSPEPDALIEPESEVELAEDSAAAPPAEEQRAALAPLDEELASPEIRDEGAPLELELADQASEPAVDSIELDEEVAEVVSVDELIGAPTPPLGAVGYDSKGREGRIHEVVRGDTLWDISEAYLGTPWVWPSIWNDNGEIENPHVIHPGDRIWITPHEMRRVSPEEADALLAGGPLPSQELDTLPAAADASQPVPEFEPVPAAMSDTAPPMRSVRVSDREMAGLISAEQLAASASIVGRVPERVLLSQEDRLYIGLGEGDVEKGDQFTVFRTREKVYDPDTGRLLGYHVEILGWVEVEDSYPETSLASIRMSNSGITLEDRLIPREPLPQEIPVQPSPQGVEGKISFFPQRRVLMGFHDYVYLNRGSLDGLEVGSPLEVFRAGYGAREVTRHETVEVPDRVVASLVVVRASGEASVAVVTNTDTELKLGDRFRAAN